MWVEAQTLRCIIEGGGDVAFINTLHINQYLGKSEIISLKKKNIHLTVVFHRYFKIINELRKQF